MVIEIPEWKFKANEACNTTFKGSQDKIFAQFGTKIALSDYFQVFYFS